MAANACSGWDNSECKGTVHCPPRCPRFIDNEGTAVVIRPPDSDCRNALLEMYDTIDDSTMGLPPEHRDDREQWLDRLLNDGWNLIVTADDEVVGHVAVVPADAADPEFVIFVRPDFQNRKIGTELLKHVIAYADDRDHEELNLNVPKGHRRAITLYEKIGFSVTDIDRPDLKMRLPLEAPLVTTVQRPPAGRD
nr:GNAT family N-acetyltransferase [Natrinema salinisoli]